MTVKHQFTEQEMDEQYRQELLQQIHELGIEQTLEYIKDYGDLFVLEDEDVSQSIPHIAAIDYLKPLLEWLYHDTTISVVTDFRFYLPGIEDSKVAPDIALVDGLLIDTTNRSKSYAVWTDGPPPSVVFEIASERTWESDVVAKVRRYRLLQIKEYFIFDPHSEHVWQGEWLERGRLVGWRLNPAEPQYQEIAKDEAGRLWSEQLNRWLVVEVSKQPGTNTTRQNLALYDEAGHKQLNAVQAEQQHTANERRLRLQAQAQTKAAQTQTKQAQTETKQAQAQTKAGLKRAEQAETALKQERERAEAAQQRLLELEALLQQLKEQ